MSQVTVITDALRRESSKWGHLSDQAASIKVSVDGLGLTSLTFYVGEPSNLAYSQAYDAFQALMSTVMGGAATEFGQVATALLKIADAYDDADAVVEVDLNAVYSV
ncbi:hypothetical protein R8Z50_30170 [Longispora sp. K20-0274]|uniref:hypothetical protein n=1 Tax=Longispora sp. K20-0274 TaxID=3088255 RepID=UPI00399B6B95